VAQPAAETSVPSRKKTRFSGYNKGDKKQGAAGGQIMKWVYWVKLYNTKFQASCLAKRIEEDWWIYGYDCPREVAVFQSKKGRYGVKYVL
jgi:hypothetical protein